MTTTEDLLTALAGADDQADDAIRAIVAAQDRADDTMRIYMDMGIAGERAQIVHDAIDDLKQSTSLLPDDISDATNAMREADESMTPAEGVTKLSAAIEAARHAGEVALARVENTDEAINSTYAHLDGSDAADDIANLLQRAKDQLEQTHGTLIGVAEGAESERERLRSAGNA